MTAPLRPAATVILLRDGPAGLEVFLVQRGGGAAFMPLAWVFPGGRVDPVDRLEGPRVCGGERTAARLRLGPEEGRAHLVAGVRETFEEAGIWLGTGAPPQEARGPLARRELALADLLERHDARLDLDALHPWAWWVTPAQEPRRFDTRFLLAFTDVDGAHDAHETVDSGWWRPAAALDAAASRGLRLAPPTWWTLRELGALGDARAARAAAEARTIGRIEPILRPADGGVEVVLPGHPDHPDPVVPGLPSSVRLVAGRWRIDGGP